MSAPNFTSSFTNSKLPSITDWCSAVCPSGPKEFTLNSQFVMFCKREWSSLVLPFLSASWNTLWRAEQVMSAWLMISTGRRLQPFARVSERRWWARSSAKLRNNRANVHRFSTFKHQAPKYSQIPQFTWSALNARFYWEKNKSHIRSLKQELGISVVHTACAAPKLCS